MGVKLILHGLIILVSTILITSHTFAESLGAYCISQIGQKPPPPKSVERTNEPAQVTFAVQGKSFRVVAPPLSRHDLILVDENNNRLGRIRAHQEHGVIKSLALGKNGWLWINGDHTDYVAHIEFSQTPPTVSKPKQLPELYGKPCSYLGRWLANCLNAGGEYSRTLDRVFVTGYPVSLFGMPLWPRKVSYEVVEGQVRRLPKQLQGARLNGVTRNTSTYEDFPNLNGVLFRGISGDALFYDGMTVTPLLEPFHGHGKNETWTGWSDHLMLDSKRIFINIFTDRRSVIGELTAGPKLRLITAPKEIIANWTRYLEFPNDARLFLEFRGGLLAEVDGALRKVVIIQEPWERGGGSGQTPDGGYMFGITKVDKRFASGDRDVKYRVEHRYYFLVRATPEAQCLGHLSADHPIVLPEN
jgi:hypothetical protein